MRSDTTTDCSLRTSAKDHLTIIGESFDRHHKDLLYAMSGFGSWYASRLQIPDQILDPVEKQHSIFVDRNNQYDLKEAREAEQASLQLNEADQVKFGKAFIRLPKVYRSCCL